LQNSNLFLYLQFIIKDYVVKYEIFYETGFVAND
jgi:hypothetical protein